jgi:hypothetical protein
VGNWIARGGLGMPNMCRIAGNMPAGVIADNLLLVAGVAAANFGSGAGSDAAGAATLCASSSTDPLAPTSGRGFPGAVAVGRRDPPTSGLANADGGFLATAST